MSLANPEPVTNKPNIKFVNLALPADSKFRQIIIKGVVPENVSDKPSAPMFNSYDIPGRSSPVQAYSGGDARTLSFSLSLHRDLLMDSGYGDYGSNILNEYMTPEFQMGRTEDSKTKTKEVKVGTPVYKYRKTASGVYRRYLASVRYDTRKTKVSREEEDQLTRSFRDLINQFKAMNYPYYSKAGVVPPMIFCEVGTHIRITGYPNITVEYKKPIDQFGRYMAADVSISITEVLEKSMDAQQVVDNMQYYWKNYGKKFR